MVHLTPVITMYLIQYSQIRVDETKEKLITNPAYMFF